MFYLKDSTGTPSVTASVFVVGCGVAILKLALSGLTLFGFTMSTFTGGDFGMAIGALGGVYVLRRSTDPTTKDTTSG